MIARDLWRPRRHARLDGRVMILGVGAQKAGTSWFFDHLARDPEVCASPIKELHFFDAWLGPPQAAAFDRFFRAEAATMRGPLRRFAAPRLSRALRERVAMTEDRAAYLRYFATRLRGEKFLLEFTPGYSLIGPEGWAHARRFLEEAGLEVRPVYLMRDPVERHYSALRMAQRDGKVADARTAFRESLKTPSLPAHGRYDRRLKSLWRVFGEERVAVGFYEHLLADPDRHLRALTDSLGLAWRKPDVARRINPSPDAQPLDEADRAAGVEAFRAVYDFVNARFGAAKPASWSA